MAKDRTVADVIETMTKEQKNTLYYYVGKALSLKIKYGNCADIGSFNDEQQKVFYYLVGSALEDASVLEIVKGDN